MNIYRCDKNGIYEFLEVEHGQAYGSSVYKINDNGVVIYLPELPRVFNSNDDIVVYDTTADGAKNVYSKEILAKIDLHKKAINNLQERLTKVNLY